mgnify:CR=1 FL=1
MSKEDQMVGLVKSFLDKNEYPYEYATIRLKTQFWPINNTMEYANVMIYIYDDMLSVSVDAPVSGTEDIFENMAIFTTLVNSEIYYAQFRVTRDEDRFISPAGRAIWWKMWFPAKTSFYYLLSEPLLYMEAYGDGICAVIDGGDPYEAFEICQAAWTTQ